MKITEQVTSETRRIIFYFAHDWRKSQWHTMIAATAHNLVSAPNWSSRCSPKLFSHHLHCGNNWSFFERLTLDRLLQIAENKRSFNNLRGDWRRKREVKFFVLHYQCLGMLCRCTTDIFVHTKQPADIKLKQQHTRENCSLFPYILHVIVMESHCKGI